MTATNVLREDVIRALVATGRWIEPVARASERAGYRCEYCGLDLLQSLETYKQFELDHIVPIAAGGDRDDPYNHALACRHCNTHLKAKWDPRTALTDQECTSLKCIDPGTGRLMLINVVKRNLPELRGRRCRLLDEDRRIIRYKDIEPTTMRTLDKQ